MLPTPFAERVLDLVATIPPGRVLTYGDAAALLGAPAPRAVGTALARFGGGVPWWRVVRAGGALPSGHEREAGALLRAEGVRLRGDPPRVDLAAHRWEVRRRVSPARDPATDGTGPPARPARRPAGTPRPSG